MGSIQARVRLAAPNGAPGAVIPNLAFETSLKARDAATLSVTTTLQMPDEQAAILEVSDGGKWITPRNGLFILQETDADGRDLTGKRTFKGIPWISALARRAVVFPPPNDFRPTLPGENKEDRSYRNPGAAISTLIAEAKTRGWGPHVQVSFDGNYDSNGEAWTADDGPVLVRAFTTLSEVMDAVVSDGKARWWTEGTTLKLVRDLAGADRTGEVRLRSGNSRPLKTDATGIATDLVVVYGSEQVKGGQRRHVEVKNPGADTTFARRWVSLTLSDVFTEAGAVKAAQAHLADMRAPLRQVGLRYEGDVEFLPFRDFQLNDTVQVRLESGWEPRDVQAVTITSGDATEVEITVGDRIVGSNTKRAKQVGKLSLGTVTGGSTALPPVVPASGIPAGPTNVRIVSNQGKWGRNEPVGRVRLAWDAVTTGVDTASISITGYEVWTSTNSLPWVRTASTVEPEVELEWPPGESRDVRVIAVSGTGEKSEPSPVIPVVPEPPVQNATVLDAPVLESASGVVLVSAPGGAAPTGFQYVTVQWRHPDAEWRTVAGQGDLSGQIAVIKAPAGSLVEVRLVWRDTAGRMSAPSPVSTIAVASVVDDIGPEAVTVDKLAVGEIWSSQAWLDTLRSGVVETEMLHPSVGSQLDISANATVQIAVGRLDDAEAQLGEFSQVVRFEPDGTVWTSPSSPISLKLSNEGVAIRNEGNAITRWTDTEMQVQRLRSEQTFIGSTVITARPGGGVTWAHV